MTFSIMSWMLSRSRSRVLSNQFQLSTNRLQVVQSMRFMSLNFFLQISDQKSRAC